MFVHEPMIRAGKSATDISEELSDLAANTAPTAVPLFKYLHQRYLRYFMEQDVVGHMEEEAAPGADIGEVKVAICFIDLTGFTQFTDGALVRPGEYHTDYVARRSRELVTEPAAA